MTRRECAPGCLCPPCDMTRIRGRIADAWLLVAMAFAAVTGTPIPPEQVESARDRGSV